MSQSPGHILDGVCNICSYGQILISYKVPSESPSPTSFVKSCTPFIIIIIIIIIIIYSFELFTSALDDGISLQSEWQQVSSSLLKSPELFSEI